MRYSTRVLVALSVLVVLVASPDARAEGVRQLRYDARVDVAVTSVGGAAWIASELLKPNLVPATCRWCYRAEDGADLLNPADREVRTRLLWKSPETAGTISSVLGFLVEPAAMFGLTALSSANDRAIDGFPVDALLITEATVLAADLNQVVKFAFARERPFVHYLPRTPDGGRALTDNPPDDNLSFFSGHTTLAFAIATSAGTINSMRNYRLAPVVWGTGLGMAASVAYLRIAADKHYFSDVVTGAVAGTIIGIGVPLLFHSAVTSSSTSTTPQSASGQALVAPAVHSAFSVGGGF